MQPSEKVLMKLADRFQVPTAFLGTVNHHELEKRIQADVCRIKKKELPSKDEVAYLRVVLLEFLSPEVTADIFLLLLRYYTSKHLLHEADELYAVDSDISVRKMTLYFFKDRIEIIKSLCFIKGT